LRECFIGKGRFEVTEMFQSARGAGVLELVLNKRSFSVSKSIIATKTGLFDKHEDLYGGSSYEVQTDVSPDIFEAFVDDLPNSPNFNITPANVSSFALLAHEFEIPDLADSCSKYSAGSPPAPRPKPESRAPSPVDTKVAGSASKLNSSGYEEKSRRTERNILILFALVGVLFVLFFAFVLFFDQRAASTTSALGIQSIVPWQLSFTSDPLDPLNGAFSYLTRKHSRNLHDIGVVTMRSSSVLKGEGNESYAPRNLLDPITSLGFASANQPGQWVEWDFQEYRVALTHYSLRIGPLGLIRSWKLEGSSDGSNWMYLDSQSNMESLKNDRPVVSFCVGDDHKFRYLRLTQTGPQAASSPGVSEDALTFATMEVFGTLYLEVN
jgi:hypothetical protein